MNQHSQLEDDSFLPGNLFSSYQEKLCECLYTFLANLHPVLKRDVVQAFMTPGKLLAQKGTGQQQPEGVWALFSLLITFMLAPESDYVVAEHVAIAIECVFCALDLLDDVEDEDQTQIVCELGVARTLNVSTTLLMLAQKALLSLSSLDVSPQKITSLLQIFEESILMATMGQHRDLLAEGRSIESCTDEDCIEIAAQKAGALMKLVCVAGAICAGSDDQTREQCAQLGELLGIAHQLDNDSHDLYHLIQEGLRYPSDEIEKDKKVFKTDLIRHKKTLPIVLAQRALSNRLGNIQQGEMSEHSIQSLNEGIISTWGSSLLYQARAQELFHTLETRHTVSVPLRLLLGFSA
jgi:geranylgeranyl pyrophosphate synthase